MQYNFTINEFEGPLDLLLHLIQRHEIDLYDIPVAKMTEQYLLYIHTMKELQLDIASEYLVMAATLIEMKSRMLLPRYEEVEDDYSVDEMDPREELMNRLIEYKKYKEAAKDLKEKEKERGLLLSRSKTDLSQFGSPVIEDHIPEGISLYDMLGAFQKMMRRKKIQKPLKTKITRQEISIETVMVNVVEKLSLKKEPVHFFDLFEENTKEVLVITFLAILELLKKNEVHVFQEGNFDELYVKKV